MTGEIEGDIGIMIEGEEYPFRFNEVTNLIAQITGEDYDMVAQKVYDTEVGKAINLNRKDILYEQVTDNVWSVVKELSQKEPEILKLCTPENITREYMKNRKKELPTRRVSYKKASDLKKIQKSRISAWRRKRGVIL